MIQSKLFVMKQEIELLWTEMSYERSTRANGKPISNVQGGLITVCFETNDQSDRILRWMTKESTDDTFNEIDKMEEGKVCFYADGFDYPPTRTYEFNDAFLVDYTQILDLDSGKPMQTAITISPAIQNYGADLIKPWNISFVPPSEENVQQESEEVPEKKLVDYYLTDSSGKKIEEYETGDRIILCIETRNRINDKISIHLEDKSHDFKYKGRVLVNDKLENHIIKSDLEKIELTVVGQFHQS